MIGVKRRYMEYFIHPQPQKRVVIDGACQAHPMPVAAAIATLKKLPTEQLTLFQAFHDLAAGLICARKLDAFNWRY